MEGYKRALCQLPPDTMLSHSILLQLVCAAWVPLRSSATPVGAFPDEERLPKFWYDLSKERLQRSLDYQDSTKTAKNLVLFIGDGMGLNTITATRILKGQLGGKSGEEYSLAMDSFPHTSLSKTFCTDSQIADSTCAATAFLCGVKTNKLTVGLSANAIYDQCNTTAGNEVPSILRWAKEAGKSVGLVTTTIVQHATPAPAYAHCVNRYWYSDSSIPEAQRGHGCTDIAHQLVHNIPDIEVIMGGGRKYMTPQSTPDPEYPADPNSQGRRLDGVNLIDKWKELKPGKAAYVWHKTALDQVDPEQTDYLMGLFEPGDMQYELTRNNSTDPSITDMVDKAIRVLSRNPQGFFLLVEGGKIDVGHHYGKAKLALYETMLMDEAVARAKELTDDRETLTVVSADHSHTLTLGGYTDRGNPIFGFAPQQSDVDGMHYTSLLYANGPGYRLASGSRADPRNDSTYNKDYMQQSAVPLTQETHAGEDVPVFARGPWSHLFKGTNEDTFIAHAMAYAACLGPFASRCNQTSTAMKPTSRAAPNLSAPGPRVLLLLLYCAMAL
ncbi:alkaline phosphatase-like isoform X2 [Polyodon spathula]|uniref:alkaline phosphatase-like isoform X2 n=1 Tax=Polyodon spathula TaxID=7913 RepID=UPI001B7E9D14|nr:alkaline phosphatase-like isoform X2 [Polyodon spathula]